MVQELLFAQTWLAAKIGIDKDESKESKQSSKFDLNALASELADLKQAMMSRAKGSSEFQSMTTISLAEEAAIKGDREELLRQLSDVGKFALECAKSAGKNLVVTAMQLS